MLPIVDDIIKSMEAIAPQYLAQTWDNVGLQIGNPGWTVNRVMVALDPTFSVVQLCCEKKVDLLITHHPLIFQPIKAIDFSSPLGAIIEMVTRHHLAIFSAHTNLDIVSGGLNDIISTKIGLTSLRLLSPVEQIDSNRPHETTGHRIYSLPGEKVETGFGRIGELDKPISFAAFARDIKSKFALKHLKVSGPPDLLVQKVAVCTGSGSSLMKCFLNSDAQVFITGDLRYHDARDAEINNRGIIDIGHFNSEHLMVEFICHYLEIFLQENSFNAIVQPYDDEKDPFEYV